MNFPSRLIGVQNKKTARRLLKAVTYVTAMQNQSIIIVTAPKLVYFSLLKISMEFYFTAIISTSQSAPAGSAVIATHDLAGFEVKYLAYTSLKSLNSAISRI